MADEQGFYKLNALQALFGTLFGVWYSWLTRDILSYDPVLTELNPLPKVLNSVFSLDFFKVFYIILSFVFLSLLVVLFVIIQSKVYSIPKQNGDFSKFIRLINSINLLTLAYIIGISGFCFTTWYFFDPLLNKYIMIFGYFNQSFGYFSKEESTGQETPEGRINDVRISFNNSFLYNYSFTSNYFVFT